MTESGFWRLVAAAFNGPAERGPSAGQRNPGRRARKLHAGMFEDGMPDGVYTVEGITGFLELKYVQHWPARPTTAIPCRLTPTQRAWLEDWTANGGIGHVLLGVNREWFLLNADEIQDDGRITRWRLDQARDAGRYGTFRTLNGLPNLLARLALG